MNEQERKWQRIYDLLDAETETKQISKIIGVSLWPFWLHNMRHFRRQKNETSHPNIGSFKTAIEDE